MRKKIILSISILILIILIGGILINPQKENDILYSIKDSKNKMLSIMVESEAGTGNYNDASSFPSTGYYLNKKLSKCINGSKISISDGNLIIKGNKTDRCYAYFDKDELGSICKGQNMAECFVKNYKKDNAIIYHDGKADYDGEDNYELEAGDLSYRYTGSNDVVHNYVCLDNKEVGNCEHEDLYRIIGFFNNEEENYEIKLIKADYTTAEETGDDGVGASTGVYKNVTSYYKNPDHLPNIMGYTWSNIDTDNNYLTSELNIVNLNQVFYNYITNKYSYLKNLIIKHDWYVNGISSNARNSKEMYNMEFNANDIVKTKANIGLMYVSDYMYGAKSLYWSKVGIDPNNFDDYRQTREDNWLYNGLHEFTISRESVNTTGFNGIASIGVPCGYGIGVDNFFAIRPTFYLNANISLLSGNGKEKNPYRIEI